MTRAISRLLYSVTLAAFALYAGIASSNDLLVVPPEVGVSVEQVDFLFPEGAQTDSDWGRVTVDGGSLLKFTNERRGYINIYTDWGWVVDNLLVDVDGISTISAYFDLGVPSGQDVTQLSAHVIFSVDPLSEFGDGDRNVFPVGVAVWNAAGVNSEDEVQIPRMGPPPPPRVPPIIPSVAALQVAAADEEFVVSDAENVEAAVNQCVPMAIANSLQYLENTTSLVIPHEHKIGLRGDDSLVGQLGEKIGRNVTSRTIGDGVWFVPMMEGKFEYLTENGLADALEHEHQGRGWGDPDADQALKDGDFEHEGITSTDRGNTVTWDFVCDELKDGEDVEIIFEYAGGGGHDVRVVGCGITADTPWMMYAHDSVQSNDSSGLETVKVNTVDIDSDGTLNLGSSGTEIKFVLSESVLNQPPNCEADGPYVAECAGPSTDVTLDGTASSDPDGDPLSFVWTGPFSGGTATGPTPTVSFGSTGLFTVGLEVSDGQAASTCSASVTIEDTTPSVLDLVVSPDVLWPPNHKLVTIQATITVDDVCDAAPTVRLVSITSNEPDNGLGDGDKPDDIQGADFGTDDREFQLRAERSGLGNGRVYTITYQVEDASGNITEAQAIVTVPKSQRKP